MNKHDEGDNALNDDPACRAYVILKILRGLADAEAGRVVDDADLERRIALLAVRADDYTQARIDELADKCTEGTLTVAERREYESFVAAIDEITLRQAAEGRVGRE